MAEPWSSDFAALAERSRDGLQPLAAFSQPKEIKMRFFKSHPALAAAISLLVLGLVSGAAYAVVREVWVSVDPDMSAPEIEHDIQDQLQVQGVPANVQVEKDKDGHLRKLKIIANGDQAGSDLENLHLDVGGKPAQMMHGEGSRRAMKLEVRCHLDDAQIQRLEAALKNPRWLAAFDEHPPGDVGFTTAIANVLRDAGFRETEITVDADTIGVVIKAPPVP